MTNSQKPFAASFPICRLEKRTSAKGSEYFSGFLGGARVTLLRSNESGKEGAEVWHLMIAEGKLFPPKAASLEVPSSHGHNERTPRAVSSHSKRDFARPRETGDRAGKVLMPAELQEIPF